MKLLQAGRYQEACPKLEESNRLDPGMGVKYRLATCFEGALRIASAWALFTQVADEAALAKMPEREKVARARADNLKLRLPRMIVLVPQAVAATPGLEVKVDGRPLRPAMFGTSLPVDAGAHTVSVGAPGRRKWETTAEANESATTTVTAPVLQAEPEVGPAAGETVPAVAFWSTPRVLSVAAAGLGVVGLAVGSGLGLDAAAKLDAAKPFCQRGSGALPDVCDPAARSLLDAGSASAAGSTVAFIAGGVFLAGGVALWIAAPEPQSRSKEEKTSLWVAPTGGGVAAGGTF